MTFSFCGVDISEYGLYYVPKPEDIFVWGEEYETHDLTVSGYDGGYWFGTTVKPKEFELECYFEEITHLQMKKIQTLFARGRTGTLVFEERPFLSYTATVTEFGKPELYVGYSGTLVLKLTAYTPFSVMDRLSVNSYDEYGPKYNDLLKSTTGILPPSQTPPVQIVGDDPITAQTFFNLYNPGDARADTIIRIAGDVGTGVSIYNNATKQRCTVKGLTKAMTTNAGKWLEIDSRSGKVYLTDGVSPVMAFLFHDNGFIQLDGGAPIERDTSISYDGD